MSNMQHDKDTGGWKRETSPPEVVNSKITSPNVRGKGMPDFERQVDRAITMLLTNVEIGDLPEGVGVTTYSLAAQEGKKAIMAAHKASLASEREKIQRILDLSGVHLSSVTQINQAIVDDLRAYLSSLDKGE